ncbi:protein EARLY FLOWERING 3 isoform X2 [Cryptomeria japonica]|uniref:protein EARLY FLOWERING 3 isoform X2 n=1 Tax=Cryptomeria japonica TaxID=3369 RepID=UPI0025AC384D|nr:protein EARLY FLOWERING 3 isoform X2 [Cryptomeria japonica]
MAEKNSRDGRKGCFVPAEKEPLFPRLHINSAGEKKGGPRAPPRNKMALYEQLSVPSRRFQQPLTPSATQGSSFEGRYSFCPVNFTPMPDASGSDVCYQVYDQSASVVTHDSAAGEGNKQFLRVPTIVSSMTMGSSYGSDKSKNQRNLPGKKVRDEDDFKVPQCSNSRISNISTTGPCIIDKFQTVENFTSNANRPSTSSSNTFQCEATIPTSSDSDYWKKGIQADSKDCSEIKDHLEQQINCSVSLNSDIDCSVSHQLLGNSSSAAPVLTSGQNTTRKNHLIGTGDNVDSVQWVGLSSNSTSEGLLLANNNIHREESVQVADINDKGEDNTDGLRERDEYDQVSSLRNSCESTGGAECSSDENAAEISVASQPMQENRFEDDSDSSMLDSVSISNITPDVVIENIGKQHFWKARKAILRQQRIFSVQVFELHRLIKVQKLMATSPILLNYDESSDAPSVKTDNANMSSDNVVEWERVKKMNGGTQTNERVNANPTELGAGWLANSEAVCYQGLYNQGPGKIMNCGENGNIYAQCFPSISVPFPGGMNTWGFPHPGFGLGQWTVPMPSPPGVFMYNPFAGAFPPAAFTGSTFSSPGSLSFPSFVGANQGAQSDLRYGFPASNMHWGSPVFSLPVASQNFLSNCCSLPFSVVDPMHETHASVAPSVFAQNGKAGEEAGLITSKPASSGIPTPCSGAFSNEQLESTLTNQSFTGVNSPRSHYDRIQSGLYTPQNFSNMPDRVREIYPDQVNENCGQLSEHNDFIGTNCLRGEEGKLQGVANDPSEKVSKAHCEEENCTKKLAYQCKMTLEKDTLALFPLLPSLGGREPVSGKEHGSHVFKVVPCNPVAAPETAARILFSIQKE